MRKRRSDCTKPRSRRAGGTRITKKEIRFCGSPVRAIDGTRTRGLDLGKVARYQLRHYRMCCSRNKGILSYFFPQGKPFRKLFRHGGIPLRHLPLRPLSEADSEKEAGTADKTIAARPNVPRTLPFPRPRLHIMQSRPSGNGRCVRAERERRARVLEAVPVLL